MDWNVIGVYVAAIAFIIPFLILASNWFIEYTGIKSNKRRRDEANERFDRIVGNLSTDNTAAQLSAAVLLRRFFALRIGFKYYLHKETVDVISSILRTLPVGIYQKTLADGLAYAHDLSGADLQRTNLQNIYLGSKGKRLKLHSTDLFMANLTYGLIDNVDAAGIILYNSLLYGTIIKNSDFSKANFVGADLTNAKFKNVVLKDADFSKAINVPSEIKKGLVNGIYQGELPVTTSNAGYEKAIFFSMPGNMSKSDETTVMAFRQHLRERGFEVCYYTRDTYPRFGQLSLIKATIERCAALVAFGTKQTFIKDGIYRPGMSGERVIRNEWLSTPWNEVEVGMAAMIGIPILLVKDNSIEDGIFDRIISESYIYTLPTDTDIKELEQNQIFTEWLSRFME